MQTPTREDVKKVKMGLKIWANKVLRSYKQLNFSGGYMLSIRGDGWAYHSARLSAKMMKSCSIPTPLSKRMMQWSEVMQMSGADTSDYSKYI